MSNFHRWPGTWPESTVVLDDELDALADGSRTDGGTVYDGESRLNKFGVLELVIPSFALAPSADAHVNVYAVTAPDGTNYGDGSSSVVPSDNALIATIDVRAVTTAQRVHSQLIQLLPSKTKFLLDNQTGQPFPASGSTLTLYA